ncbi:MAG: HAD hydrolase-like protein [Deltaproteobacteria bacterium]|nr:HAD hydrolase-like protein [Deltaproteobacteria bacterium]
MVDSGTVPLYECLLFDLDGVIADSRYAITRSINHALETHGLPTRPERELERYIGPPLLEAFGELLAADGADPGLAAACVTAYRERYEVACLVETLAYPGVDRVVERLAARMPLAVATSKPTRFAEPILEELGLRGSFRVVVGPDLTATKEAKTETVARALEAMGQPASAAIVGDRHHDIDAGRANEIATVGVTWGFGSREELEAADADVVLDSPEALLEHVDGAR